MRLGPGDERYELAHALAAALNARDLERVIELTSEDLEFHSMLATAEGRVFRGLAGMREWAESVDSAMDDFRIELCDVHAAGDDRVVVRFRATARGRSSGVPLDFEVGQVWTWRDGVPWRNEVFSNPDDALRAVGLDPAER